jgi:hypothetical protein
LIVGLVAVPATTAHAEFTVTWGTPWDGVSLQQVLDAEYGAGAIDAASDYIGAQPQDLDPPYWLDAGFHSWVVRELAGSSGTNDMGWYEVGCCRSQLEELVDKVILAGPTSEGATVELSFPSGVTSFGFYLNPNGDADAPNAPEPELFFTNRFYNDIGPSGQGALHEPSDGDPQCLVYNITQLRDGVPTFVLAWEDQDSGGTISPGYLPDHTDNDFQDLVVEVSAGSPMPTDQSSWGQVKALFEGDR